MKVDQEIIELILELEHIVGQECFNPHSIDGYTWEEGNYFRYPVVADISKGIYIAKEKKFYGKIPYVIPENIATIKYKFGANYLYIGIAIKKVLQFLEQKYSINFNYLNMKNNIFKNGVKICYSNEIDKLNAEIDKLEAELDASEDPDEVIDLRYNIHHKKMLIITLSEAINQLRLDKTEDG